MALLSFLRPDEPQTSFLDRLMPVNLEEERDKFFFDPKYNPQFEYDDDFDPKELRRFGKASTEFLPVAQNVLKKVSQEFGDNETYSQKTQGRLLSQHEVELAVRAYLKENHLEQELSVRYSPHFHARTSIYKSTLRIRLPHNYRENGLLGTLHHEIGTHFFRRKNDLSQPWRLHHEKYHLHPYLETEEGMAVLHSQIPALDRHLWFPSLMYFAVCRADELSWSDLNAELKQYVSDRDRRFKICLKVKRGQRDTSQPGSFPKEQLYLRGSIVAARWLIEHNFAANRLYLGKIACEDVEAAEKLSALVPENIVLPQFLADREAYKEAVKEIISVNRLPVK